MKFSTFIIIALLSLIAYGLLQPAPSPNALQEFFRLAQQWIPPAKTSGQESHPVAEPPLKEPTASGQSLPPIAQLLPLLIPKPQESGSGNPSYAQPRRSVDPLANGDDDIPRKPYSGWVREHLNGDCLLVRSGTRSNPDSGADGEYVLAGFPGAGEVPVNTQISFYAYLGGVVPYNNDTETKTVSILVYSPAGDPGKQQASQISRPAENTPPSKPSSWMWEQKGSLDRGPYNRK